MDKLVQEATRSTPSVEFDPDGGELTIKGDAFPEDAAKFFQPLLTWLRVFMGQSRDRVQFNVDLNYINSSSTKCLLMMFDVLEESHSKDNNVAVKWFFDSENDVAREIGEEFKEDYTIPFTFVEYQGDEAV